MNFNRGTDSVACRYPNGGLQRENIRASAQKGKLFINQSDLVNLSLDLGRASPEPQNYFGASMGPRSPHLDM
jgi:hypothetical protein